MQLGLREAATLMGMSERTLRAWLARGRVAGTKRDGRWLVERGSLPLTEAQRATMQDRAEAIRDAVEAALPSRVATRADGGRTRRRRSIADLDTFRAANAVRGALLSAAATAEDVALGRAARSMRSGLLELCEGVHAFEASSKIRALRRARRSFSRAVGLLLIDDCGSTPDGVRHSIVERLETEVLPSLGGLLRWSERLGRSGDARR